MREKFVPNGNNKSTIFDQWCSYYKKNYDPYGFTFIEEVREHFFWKDYGKSYDEAVEFLSGYTATEELVKYL